MSDSFEVIAIGSGGAGLMGALAAARAGRRVLVIERSDLVGGSTAVSGGYVWAPNHCPPGRPPLGRASASQV